MSQIDPRMILIDPKGSEQWPKPKEGPKVTEEIQRSGGDPTRSKIWEYQMEVSWLSIVVGDTRVRTWKGMPVGVGWSHVSLNWGCVRGRREWTMIGRKEASLMTSAISGLANMGTCTVTWHWGSWGRSGRDDKGGIKERPKETGGEGEGVIVHIRKGQINCSRSRKVSWYKVVTDYKNHDTRTLWYFATLSWLFSLLRFTKMSVLPMRSTGLLLSRFTLSEPGELFSLMLRMLR